MVRLTRIVLLAAAAAAAMATFSSAASADNIGISPTGLQTATGRLTLSNAAISIVCDLTFDVNLNVALVTANQNVLTNIGIVTAANAACVGVGNSTTFLGLPGLGLGGWTVQAKVILTGGVQTIQVTIVNPQFQVNIGNTRCLFQGDISAVPLTGGNLLTFNHSVPFRSGSAACAGLNGNLRGTVSLSRTLTITLLA